jgi:peptide/nickel transport system substrate-binding protein
MYPAHLPFAKQTQETDEEEAARLLDEAGWELGSGEYRERDGQRLTLKFIVNEQVADLMALAVALQDQLRNLGVEVKIQEVADIVELTGRSDDWSVGFLLSNVFGGDYVGDVQRYLGPGGRYNVGHVDDPELNELIEQAFAETDPDAQYELLGSIQDVVADQSYAIHPVERRTAVVAAPAWEDYFISMNNRWVEADTGGPGS